MEKAIESWVCAFKIWNEFHDDAKIPNKRKRAILFYESYRKYRDFLRSDIYHDTEEWAYKPGETVFQDVMAAAEKFYMDGYRELTE